MISFMKKPIVIISLIVIIGGIIVNQVYFGKSSKLAYDFIVAERSSLIQEVSVTGRVRPAESVELAFEKTGKVSRVNISIGNKVKAGQVLVSLVNSGLAAQLLQAEADLEAEQAKLSELQKVHDLRKLK